MKNSEMEQDILKVLVTEEEIHSRVQELGAELSPEDFVKLYRWVDWKNHMHNEIFFARAGLEESAVVLQKEEVIGVQWVSKQEMLAFVRDMDYRTEDYRHIMADYIETCIPEGEGQ